MGVILKRKACATCTYWTGERKINSFKDGVTTEKSNTLGECTNPKSLFKRKDTKADYGSCTKYEKWDVLSKMR